MSQANLLEVLVKLFIIVVFIRLAITLIPPWLLAIIAILLIWASNILDPMLLKTVYTSSTPLLDLLLPFFFILLAFSIASKGIVRKR